MLSAGASSQNATLAAGRACRAFARSMVPCDLPGGGIRPARDLRADRVVRDVGVRSRSATTDLDSDLHLAFQRFVRAHAGPVVRRASRARAAWGAFTRPTRRLAIVASKLTAGWNAPTVSGLPLTIGQATSSRLIGSSCPIDTAPKPSAWPMTKLCWPGRRTQRNRRPPPGRHRIGSPPCQGQRADLEDVFLRLTGKQLRLREGSGDRGALHLIASRVLYPEPDASAARGGRSRPALRP